MLEFQRDQKLTKTEMSNKYLEAMIRDDMPMPEKAARGKGKGERNRQEQPTLKLKRLREKIQDLDLLLLDVKHYATDFCLDELVQARVESTETGSPDRAPDYRRPSRPQDWGKEIDKKSFVYFIFCPQVSAIKIGYTKDLRARISSLQTGNPWRLKMLAWMEGGRTQEAALHQFFRCYHAGSGEWFFYEGDLFDYVLAVIKNQPAYLDPYEWMQDEQAQATPLDLLESATAGLKTLEEVDVFLSGSPALPSAPSFQLNGSA